jgi:hypothetical protein
VVALMGGQEPEKTSWGNNLVLPWRMRMLQFFGYDERFKKRFNRIRTWIQFNKKEQESIAFVTLLLKEFLRNWD